MSISFCVGAGIVLFFSVLGFVKGFSNILYHLVSGMVILVIAWCMKGLVSGLLMKIPGLYDWVLHRPGIAYFYDSHKTDTGIWSIREWGPCGGREAACEITAECFLNVLGFVIMAVIIWTVAEVAYSVLLKHKVIRYGPVSNRFSGALTGGFMGFCLA